MLCGIAYGFREALFVTIIDAAIRNVVYDVFAELIQAILFVDNKLDPNLPSIIFKAIAPSLVLDVWMNVWIVPKKRRLYTLGAQDLHNYNIYVTINL